MDKVKQWVALTVVGCLAIVAGGWFLLVSPKRSDAAQARAAAAQQESTNQSLELQLQTLKGREKSYPALAAKLAQISQKVPDNPALPSLVRALSKAATDAGVELVTVAPSAPALVTAAAPTTPTHLGAGAASATTPSAATGAATSSAAGTLQSVGLSLTVAGKYFQVEQFFEAVEHLQRAMKVTSLQLGPGPNPVKVVSGTATAADPAVTADLVGTITANVYMVSGRLAAPASPTVATGK